MARVGVEVGFVVIAHAKVTVIAHSVSGMSQVWYRVTGETGVTNRQLAYRAGTGAEDVRRVRFGGTGATAAPVHAAIVDALAAEELDLAAVFATRDAGAWWRAVERAAGSGRSVSSLTAAGLLRATTRAGATVDVDRLHAKLGAVARERATGAVTFTRARPDAVTQLDLDAMELAALNDTEVGERAWTAAAEGASRHEPVGNAWYELTLTLMLTKSISLCAPRNRLPSHRIPGI